MESDFCRKIAYIENELRSAGYEPYAQLNWFIRTNDARYITRRGNARKLITELDRVRLIAYVTQMQPE